MSLVMLWTDALVWLLVFAGVLWAWRLSGSAEAKRKWGMVFGTKTAMITAVILTFYLLFALLDSIHFKVEHSAKRSGEIVSVLDMAFAHQKDFSERTYSAPFATHEYAKSIVVGSDGIASQRYLPLKYISTDDMVYKNLLALALGVGISFLLIGGHLWYRKKKGGHSTLPWKSAYVSLSVVILLFTWLYVMSFSYHVLGTDKVGGDLFYASMKSIRTGVLIGVLTTLVTLPLAIVLGVSAGFFRGWVDDAIQYLYTTLSSIPGVLLIAAGVLSMQVMMDNHPDWFASTIERSDLRLLFLILILGVTSWTGLCRMLRAETLRISQMDYVTAAKAFGVSRWRIMLRHIVPNLTHIILISVVLDFSGLVLAEAVLSYVGVGVDPTMYSWGNMINQARLEMAREPMVWWSLFSAFVFMFILVLAANLLSDRVQRVLDPRNRS